MGGVGAGVPVSSAFEDFEAFSADAHVAELDFGAESDDVDHLQCKLTRIGVTAMYVVREEGNVKTAEMWD